MPEEAAPATELSARDEGTGPPVVLLHGVAGNRNVWNGLLTELDREFRVIAPDLRGHGRSAAPAGSKFTFAELAGDVLALLDSKSLDRVHWVGLSGGALLALRLALDHPERTRSLVLISGAAYTDAHTRSIANRWSETLAREGPDAFALRLLKDLYYPDWIEAHLDFADQLREQVRHQDLAPAVAWAVAMGQFDERRRIASIRFPTLIVQAMDDAVVDASHGRILRQSIPGAQIRILPQTGHLIPLERPRETLDAIAGFVRTAEGASASSAHG